MQIKRIVSSLCLLALTGSVFADYAGKIGLNNQPGRFYIGAFGGVGSSNEIKVHQFGTAFYLEALGGPLAVNAFGHTRTQSSWFAGAQVGYQAPGIVFNSSQWAFVPAAEMEGFYLGNDSFKGTITNNTARLPEHTFSVKYPMSRSVFLANVIFGFDKPCLLVHPYVGVGFGGAVVRISGADALQVAPVEAGVNHYNANTSDTDPTFAAQIKAGLTYDITQNVSVFAEYRWLYLSSTNYLFGSTVYPNHPETSNWNVRLDHQNYNMGTIGIRFNM